MNIIKSISHRLSLPIRLSRLHSKRLFNFILPNLGKIFTSKISFLTYPTCNQKTLITGSGFVKIGKYCVFGYKPGGHFRCGVTEIQARFPDARIIVGNNVITNNNLYICCGNYIEIGDDTLIGERVLIADFEAHGMDPDKRMELGEIGKVIIGRNVWIGNNAIILKNTEIGKNTIVAAGAVVSGKFPENVIIGGIPAKIIKDL